MLPGIAILIAARDGASQTLQKLSQAFDGFGGNISAAGEKMQQWGEKAALAGALASEGAEHLKAFAESAIEPAEAMQTALAHTAAVTDLSSGALERLHQAAVAFSDTHAGATAEGYVNVFTQLQGVMHNTTSAITATGTALELAKVAHIDASQAAAMLTTTYANLGVAAPKTGDMVAATIREFGLSGEAASSFTESLGRLAGAAKATGSPLAEIMSIAGQAGQLIAGGRGAELFASSIQSFIERAPKSGIDVSHGVVSALMAAREQIKGLDANDAAQRLRALGLNEELLPLLDLLDKLGVHETHVANSANQLGSSWGKATSDAASHVQVLRQSLDNLLETVGGPALSAIAWWSDRIAGLLQRLGDFMDRHQTLGKWLTLGAAGIGGLITSGVVLISTFGALISLFGIGLQSLVQFGSTIGVVARGVGGLIAWMRDAQIVTKLWGGAQWLLNAAMEANPIGLLIVGAAALAVAAYEIYEHWNGVKTFFINLGTWLESAGANLMHALANGIKGAISAPVYAIENVAGRIGRFVVGHSPPPEGPLHDLAHPGLMETLSSSIRPQPVLGAIRAVAGAAMLAMPMIAGPALAAPALASAALGSGVSHAAAAPVINYRVTVNGSNLDEDATLRVLRKHAHDLYEIWRSEGDRRSRTEF